MRTLKTNDDTRDLAIALTDALVQSGIVPDCIDTDDESEFRTQDLLHGAINLYLLGGNEKPRVRKWNHLLDVGFTVVSTHQQWDDIPVGDIINALKERVRYLENNPSEAAEAFGYGHSSYEMKSND